MKRTALFLSLITASVFAAGSASAQDLKVGIVDMTRVFTEYHKTKSAEADLETAKEGARGELQEETKKLEEFKKQLDDLAKSVRDPAVSAAVREAKTKKHRAVAEEAMALQDEVREFARRREMQLLEMFNRKRDEILEELKEAVTKKSTHAGYDLVFDKSCRSTRDVPFLLYSKDAGDFSAELIAELNASN